MQLMRIVLGEVPQGLPSLGVPALRWSDLNELLPLALACFLLGAVETVAIGRTFAQKHGYRLDSNQEFLALAGANDSAPASDHQNRQARPALVWALTAIAIAASALAASIATRW